MTGFFGGPSLLIGSHTLHGNGQADAFIAGFDETGRVLGALSFGGSGYDRPRWIGNASLSTTLVAGRFGNNMIVGVRELRAVGDFDGMLLELALPWLDSR